MKNCLKMSSNVETDDLRDNGRHISGRSHAAQASELILDRIHLLTASSAAHVVSTSSAAHVSLAESSIGQDIGY